MLCNTVGRFIQLAQPPCQKTVLRDSLHFIFVKDYESETLLFSLSSFLSLSLLSLSIEWERILCHLTIYESSLVQLKSLNAVGLMSVSILVNLYYWFWHSNQIIGYRQHIFLMENELKVATDFFLLAKEKEVATELSCSHGFSSSVKYGGGWGCRFSILLLFVGLNFCQKSLINKQAYHTFAC